MKKSILFGIALLSFSVSRLAAQIPHYQFPSLLASLSPKPPSSVDEAQGLSELKHKNVLLKDPGYWAPGEQVVLSDSLMGRKVMEAAGMLPASGAGASTPAMPTGIDPDKIKQMTPAEQSAFAQQYMAQAMSAPRPGSVPIQEDPKVYPLIGEADSLSQILYALPIELSGGIDSLTAISDAKHQKIEDDYSIKKSALDTQATGGAQQGESQGMSDAQKELVKQKDADQKSTENDCLSACSAYIAKFVGRLSPLLRSAETLEDQLQDGKAIQSSVVQHQYTSFLSTALTPIAAVMSETVAMTHHADKWIPIPQL
ncbi:MAG TPA: hypothetical protein VFD13_08105 [Candidatus Kapabacteria bacterium]|nr:hypothetical protein [Candidatus Kapabacteria bacterium]